MRILHIFSNPHITNGATVFEYRVSGCLKKRGIFFDYLVTEEATEDEKKRYAEKGSRLYRLPIDNRHGLLIRELKVNSEYYRFFKKHPYDIVYADTENALRSVHLFMARLAGVPVRVVHSHNTGLQTESRLSRVIARYLKGFFRFSATDYFACSDKAAKWLFPNDIYRKKNYKLLKNGVDLDKFGYSREIREKEREKLGIQNKYVLGNVGRFMPQKNHLFLLDIFSEVVKKEPDSVLMLIGEGPLRKKAEERAGELGIREKVLFIGNVPDVENYLQAMDCFVMPSLFEGLPITGIEAQASGLSCLFSDTITKELAITDLSDFMSLDESAEKWAARILTYRNRTRKNMKEKMKKEGYSIYDTADWLESFYRAHSIKPQ